MSYTPTTTLEERRAYWNMYKIEDNGSVKLFQVRRQDNRWYLRIVTRKKGERVGLSTAQEFNAIEGDTYLKLANC